VRGRSTLILLAACAAALVACGGSADNFSTVSPTPSSVGTSTATASASSSVTASPTQTGPLLTGHGVSPGEVPPTRSTYSLQHSSDGALAFAAYFYKALDWSIATTDPYLLRQVSAATCDACSRLINEMTLVESAGGYSTGGRIAITDIAKAHGTLVSSEYVFQIRGTQSNEVVVHSAGAAASSYAYGDDPVLNYLYVSWSGTGWTVLGLQQGMS
jgi:Family of unknown function (DUF6318)